jgi:myo-inositol-1(or 4)-monophosphatase
MWLDKLLLATKEAAIIGGQVIKENFNKVKTSDIEEKAPKDFVSYVDKTSEERIRNYLKSQFPEIAILGEEGGIDNTNSDLLWVIDPLDGTKNFLAGFPIFGVSVALVDASKNFRPLVGAVYFPYFGDLYYASKGGGAYKNGNPIKVNSKDELKKCFYCYGFPSRAKRDLNTYCGIMLEIFKKVASLRRPGAAAVDLAYVAEGVFDGNFEFELKLWDVAAGTLLVQEAGGKVAWLNFNPETWTMDIVSSIPEFFDEIKTIVESKLNSINS